MKYIIVKMYLNWFKTTKIVLIVYYYNYIFYSKLSFIFFNEFLLDARYYIISKTIWLAGFIIK